MQLCHCDKKNYKKSKCNYVIVIKKITRNQIDFSKKI